MILIVDDDSAVRSSLSFMLKRAGYEVKTAPGPREAMDIVRAESPALILMDMNFTLSTTGEEGLTLLKQVKVFRPDVPVILMTAWGSIQLAVQGMQAGAFDQTVEQCRPFAAYRNRLGTECRSERSAGRASGGFEPQSHHRKIARTDGGAEYRSPHSPYQRFRTHYRREWDR